MILGSWGAIMFYFHGAKGRTFALVTDDHLQINAYFIGTRPQGRPRDFTLAPIPLSVLFRSHALSVSARRVSASGTTAPPTCSVLTWDDREIIIPTDGEAEWKEHPPATACSWCRWCGRTRSTASGSPSQGVVEIDVKAVPVSEEDNRVHNYQIPAGPRLRPPGGAVQVRPPHGHGRRRAGAAPTAPAMSATVRGRRRADADDGRRG
ncbi:hypothetical protein ACLOJK_009340 [Asimina triloba]